MFEESPALLRKSLAVKRGPRTRTLKGNTAMAKADRNNPLTLEDVREQLRIPVAEITQTDSFHDYGYFKGWVGALY